MTIVFKVLGKDPVEEMIDKMLEAEVEQPRHYLGASYIGHNCGRFIWYSYKNFNSEPIAGRNKRCIQDGHDTELKIINWLKKCGITFKEKPDGTQFGFSSMDGRYRGHYDGIAIGFPQAPKTWHIFEVKTVNEQKFKKLKELKEADEKSALKKWDAVYYAQAMVYCYKERLDRHITVCATPGGRDIISVRTDADDKFAEFLDIKAENIINAQEPPERIGNEDFFVCKMCKFRFECHK